MFRELEFEDGFQEVRKGNLVTDDLGRLERVGASPLLGFKVKAFPLVVGSVLCGQRITLVLSFLHCFSDCLTFKSFL
jgi:hypothetical protein